MVAAARSEEEALWVEVKDLLVAVFQEGAAGEQHLQLSEGVIRKREEMDVNPLDDTRRMKRGCILEGLTFSILSMIKAFLGRWDRC